MLVLDDALVTSISSFVLTKTLDAMTGQRRVKVFGSAPTATGAKIDTGVAAEASLVQEAQALRSSVVLVRER